MIEQNSTTGNNSQDWLTMSDPNEGGYTVQLPKEWQNQACLIRVYDQPRSVVTSRSPDGGAFLFMGDPNLPGFMDPSALPDGSPMMPFNPMTQIHPFVPADAFLPQYVHRQYGHMSGFRITNSGPSPVLERIANESAHRSGLNVRVTTARVAFDYSDNGVTMHALIHGTTLSMGTTWIPDVSGILTRDDPDRYNDMLLWMVRSYRTNPQWRQNQDSIHLQRMAIGTANHQSTMSAMQSGHQARMRAIHQAGAANTQMFHERQVQTEVNHQSFINSVNQPTSAPSAVGVQSDASHERFLNYIKDENTVIDQSGQGYQVETGQERYYINKNDNTYIGTDSTVEREDLRSRFGVNPDNYEETKIKR